MPSRRATTGARAPCAPGSPSCNLENDATSARLVALCDCTVEAIPREHIYGPCETRPKFADRFYLSLATLLAGRVRQTNARIE